MPEVLNPESSDLKATSLDSGSTHCRNDGNKLHDDFVKRQARFSRLSFPLVGNLSSTPEKIDAGQAGMTG
ncbi:MAG: hypothetical protein AB1442_10070 [Nitrospirota bacterium]